MDTDTDRIIINVGGKRHETYASTLQTIPDTRLSWLAGSYLNSDNKQEYFFDRNPKLFGIILNYYRTGQLHAPRDFCGPLFQEELAFWGIEEKEMEACCWPYYTQHRDAEKNLKDFVGPEFEDSDENDDEFSPEYDSAYGQATSLSWWTIYRPKVWAVMDDAHSSTKAKVFALTSLFMILASVASMCASSVVKDKNNVYIQAFEYAFCAWFTLEFGARLLFCPDKIAFFKEIMTWVDIISLLPFYENMILDTGKLDFLRAVRLIRTFRALKVFAFTSGLQIIVQSLKASFRELILLLIILLIPVVVFSSIVFEIETNEAGQEDFQNIPQAFWWAIITMTTVGYGDMVPKTIPGRIIGGVCAIFGVLIVALPVSVIGNNFSTYYSHAQARLSLPKKKRRLICEVKLRNHRQGQTPSSTTSLRPNGIHEVPDASAQESSRASSATKYRRYHRRSRNTLFAHGDVYIGPSRFDRPKIHPNETYNEEDNENETESETWKSECPTTKETISSGDLDNRSEKAGILSSPGGEELPDLSALPRNFTLINSMHESEEIIEEDTRPHSVLSERRGTRKKKKYPSLQSSRLKKSSSPLSRSWIELKTEHAQSPQENGRPHSSRGSKARVSPVNARGSYKNPAMEMESPSSLSSPRLKMPSFKMDMETTRLDKGSLGTSPGEETNSNSAIVSDNNHRTGKVTERDFTNGFIT